MRESGQLDAFGEGEGKKSRIGETRRIARRRQSAQAVGRFGARREAQRDDAVGRRIQGHLLARRHLAHDAREEVAERVADLHRVDGAARARNGLPDPHDATVQIGLDVRDDALEELSHLDRLGVRRSEPGEREHVLEEAVHALDRVLRELVEALAQLGVLEERGQMPCEGLDRHHRVPELVRQLRHEELELRVGLRRGRTRGRGGGDRRDVEREVVRLDRPLARDEHRARENRLELDEVAGPGVRGEPRDRARCDGGAVAGENGGGERGEIGRPLREPRQLEDDPADPRRERGRRRHTRLERAEEPHGAVVEHRLEDDGCLGSERGEIDVHGRALRHAVELRPASARRDERALAPGERVERPCEEEASGRIRHDEQDRHPAHARGAGERQARAGSRRQTWRREDRAGVARERRHDDPAVRLSPHHRSPPAP